MKIMDRYSRNIIASSQKYEKEKHYWLEKLGNIEDINSNWTCCRQHKSLKGIYAAVDVEIIGDTFHRIVNLGKKSDHAIYMILLSAVKYLFCRYTGCNHLIVGMPAFIKNRNSVHVNEILPVIANIRPEMTYKELLIETKKTVTEADEYKGFPVLNILEQMEICNETTYQDFYKTVVLLKNIHDSDCLHDLDYEMCFSFDLSENQVGLSLSYDTGLFRYEVISQICRHFINFLDTALNKPDIILDQIDILGQEDYKQILDDLNDTACLYEKEKTIHQVFEEQVNQTPDMVAIVYKGEKITYRELNKRANSLAHKLRQKGVKPDEIVGLMVERTPEMLIGILGILKAGGAYLPIDPTYPEDRVSYMLEDSGTTIMLSHRGLEDKVDFGGEIIDIDSSEAYAEEDCNPEIVNESGDLAYIIYTSGSTGNPKGVMLEHRSVINFFKGMTDRIDFTCGKTILALTTLSFDIFVLETLLPLSRGLKIVMADEKQQLNPKELNRLIAEEKVDMLQATPSRMQLMIADINGVSSLGGLKEIMIGGEAFPVPLLEKLKTITGARIFNMYGPTETTVWSTVKELTGSDGINIGTPIANTQIYILDKNNRPVPVGVPGELYIGGDGLARGYHQREELTKERFVENLFRAGELMYKTGDIARWTHDGEIDFMGRADYQVKIRGYRIELGEIESVLLKHAAIKEAAVIARDSVEGIKSLYAYYSSEDELTVGELRSHLLKELPDYMVPSYFIHLNKIPLTPNGKVDRKALPEIIANTCSGIAIENPANETEDIILKLWKNVVSLPEIGVNHDFFESGGNSLLANKLEVELEKAGIQINVNDIFNYRTVRQQANFILNVKDSNETITGSPKEFISNKYGVTDDSQIKADAACLDENEVEPFNDLFYKNCFYNSLFPAAIYFKKSIVPFIMNDIILYTLETKESASVFDANYMQLGDEESIYNDIGIYINKKEKSDQIIEDIKESLSRKKLVIARIDCYYEPARFELYQKEHWPHTLLVYGFNDEKQELNIIEHLFRDNLSYKKMTISYNDFINAYQGFIETFGNTEKYTYYELGVQDETVELEGNKGIEAKYIHSYRKQLLISQDQILAGLKNIISVSDEFTSIIEDEALLNISLSNILAVLNNIINAKKIDVYKHPIAFPDFIEGQALLDEITGLWDSIRRVLAKYLYSSVYKRDTIMNIANKFKKIYALEYRYYCTIFEKIIEKSGEYEDN